MSVAEPELANEALSSHEALVKPSLKEFNWLVAVAE